MPDFELYYERMMAKGSRVNMFYCWLDYKAEHPNGYQSSQFYEYFNRFIEKNYVGDKVAMAVERIPGEKMYIDWVGAQPELLVDPHTGEIKKVHVFTTTLGVSSLVYAECFLDEKLPNFMQGTINAITFYDAVPRYFVPYNCKTAVIKHTKDELILNTAYQDLEEFYNVVILPPPARKPKGKPSVENHVRYLETHLIEKLKEGIYTSLESLNDATQKIIADINRREFQKKIGSRIDAYLRYDKPQMKTNKLTAEEMVIVDRLKQMKMSGMAEAYEEQLLNPNSDLISFQARFSAIIDFEWELRFNKKFNRFLKKATLRYPQASFDETIYEPDRMLDTETIELLSTCKWLDEGRNLLITGATGAGKSYISNALCIAD